MVNYREILRLDSLNYSQRQISASAHSSRHTIHSVLETAKKMGVAWPLEDSITNAVLESTFFPERNSTQNIRKEPDYGYIHNELAKSGVSLSLLWNEYCEDCHSTKHTPYMYSQFCNKYRKWARLTKAMMHIHHKPGDTMQVDWAGSTIPVHDKITGETHDANLFIAVLPCSCKTYAEACENMRSET